MSAYETPIFFDMFITYRTPYQAPSRIAHVIAIFRSCSNTPHKSFYRQN